MENSENHDYLCQLNLNLHDNKKPNSNHQIQVNKKRFTIRVINMLHMCFTRIKDNICCKLMPHTKNFHVVSQIQDLKFKFFPSIFSKENNKKF